MNTIIKESLKTGLLSIYCAECDEYVTRATEGGIKHTQEELCHICCELPEHNHNTEWVKF